MAVEAEVQRFELFRGLPEHALRDLGRAARVRILEKGETLFSPGEESSALYGVLEGCVNVWTVSGSGAEITLNILGEGELLGEIGVLDGGPRTAGASAAQTSRLLSLRRADIFSGIANEPELARRTIALLCRRLRWVCARMEDSAFRSAPERLARMLEHLRCDHGRPVAAGVEIAVRLTQGELARWTLMSREGLNKIIARWSGEGLLTARNGRFVLHDNGRLAEIAEFGEEPRSGPSGPRA